MSRTYLSSLTLVTFLAAGCVQEKKAPVKPQKATTAAPAKAEPAPQPAADTGQVTNPGCFGDPKGGEPREVTAGSLTLKGNGYTLAATASPEKSGKLVVGIVSDLKDKHDGWEARV